MSVPGGPPMQPSQQPYPGQAPYGQPPMQQRPADPAKTAAIMLGVAALLMLLGVATKSWVTAGVADASMGIGPLGVQKCFRGVCGDTTANLDGDLEIIMLLAALAGFVAAAGCAWFAFAVFTGKTDKVPPVKLAQLATAIATGVFILFVIRVFADGDLKGAKLGPGWSMFVGIGGAILAVVGIRKVTPYLGAAAHRPMNQFAQGWGQPQQAPYAQQPYQQPYGQQMQQQMPQQQMPQQQMPQQPMPQQAAAPTCPRCGQPLQFVAQYQRWFCAREQQYV